MSAVATEASTRTPGRPPCRPARAAPRTVLFLAADTGGGHRAAAAAIGEALDRRHPGGFATVVCDPLTGPDAHPLLRRTCRWYGPLTRRAPVLWALAFHLSDTRATRWLLRRLVARLAVAPISASISRHRPAVVVSAHPLVVDAAVAARRRSGCRPSLVTVVTDLATAHGSWWHPRVDRTITPSARLLAAGRRAGAADIHGDPLGIPVRDQFRCGPSRPAEKAALRIASGVRPGRFVVLVTAGAEGGRGLLAWTSAIVGGLPEVDVVAVCGRNEVVRSRLERLAAGTDGRLLVTGEVEDMAVWIRSADLVVTKAGPSIIAEAAAVGVPLLLPAHIPGQEAGNAEIAEAAGAAVRVRGRRRLLHRIDALRRDPAAMAGMRAAAERFGRPHAAIRIAELVADEAHAGAPALDHPMREETR